MLPIGGIGKVFSRHNLKEYHTMRRTKGQARRDRLAWSVLLVAGPVVVLLAALAGQIIFRASTGAI